MRSLIWIALLAVSLVGGCANQTTQPTTQPTVTIVQSPTTPPIDQEKQALAACKQAVVEKFNIWSVVFLDANHTILKPEPHVRGIRSTALAMRRMTAQTILSEPWVWFCTTTYDDGQWVVSDVFVETYRKK